MQKIMIVLSILISSSWAQEAPEELMSRLITKNGLKKEQRACYVDQSQLYQKPEQIKSLKSNKKNCLTALCGQASKIENTQELIERLNATTPPSKDKMKFNNMYDKLIEKIISNEFERNKLLFSTLSKLSEKKKYNFSEAGNFYLLINFAISNYFNFAQGDKIKLNEFYNIATKKKGISVILNEKRLEKSLKKNFPKKEERDLYRAVIKSSFSKYFFLRTQGASSNDAIIALTKEEDPLEGLKSLSLQSVKAIKGLPTQQRKILDEGGIIADITEHAKNIKNHKYPANDRLEDILISFLIVKTLVVLNDKIALKTLRKAINLDKRVHNSLKKIDWKKRLALLNTQRRKEKLKKQVLAKCMAQRDFALEALPTKKEIEAFKKVITQSKERFISRVANRFSKQSRTLVSTMMEDLHFQLPQNKDEYKNDLLISMQKKLDQIKSQRRQLETGSKLDKESVIIDYISEIDNSPPYLDDEGGFALDSSQLTAICDEQTPKSYEDSFGGLTLGTINISWHTIMQKNSQTGTLFHEFSHLVSTALRNKKSSKDSREKYNSIRKCLNENHLKKGETKTSQLYTEEDWADLLEAVSMKKDDKNSMCIDIEKNTNEYSEVNNTLENFNKEDPHSSVFYRVLQIHLFKNGSYPRACRGLLKGSKNPFPRINCALKLKAQITK